MAGEPKIIYTFTSTACTSASACVSEGSDERKYLLVLNKATTDLFLVVTATSTGKATVAGGLQLQPAGNVYDRFEMTPARGNLSAGWVHLIGNSTGSKTALVVSSS